MYCAQLTCWEFAPCRRHAEPERKQQQPVARLHSGASMPLFGLGTWKSKPGEVAEAVKTALEAGYRHVDAAFVYQNQPEVGAAFRHMFEKGLKREELFVTSKLWNTCHRKEDVMPALKHTLKELSLDYLDLYLIHWPHAFKAGSELFPKDASGKIIFDTETHFTETWAGLEECVDAGLVRSIGFSNFNSKQIDEVLAKARIKPSVLQIESHPYLQQRKLIAFAQERGLVVTAYSPLGSPDRPWTKPGDPSLFEDPSLLAIAQKHGKTVAQVVLRFQVQRGVSCIPKSVTASRIKSNMEIFDFELDEQDLRAIVPFEKGWRACVPCIQVDGQTVPRDKEHPLFPFNLEF